MAELQQQQELPDHFMYEQCKREEAQAIAYVFLGETGDPVQYPFKFNDLEQDQLRIQVQYVGLCQSDCLHVRLKWSPYMQQLIIFIAKSTFPACPGHELIGKVEQVGTDIENYKVGDFVACNPQGNWCENCEHCLNGRNNLCADYEEIYEPYFGGYATHVQVKAKSVFKVPEGLKLELGAPLLCAGSTVFAALKRYGKQNINCAIVGIGGLGHLAIQYAAKMGMIVTAFTTSMDRKEELMKLGASHVLNSENIDQAELGKHHLVLCTSFGSDIKKYVSYQGLVKSNGTYVQLGVPPQGVNFKFDHDHLVLNQIRVCGSQIGSYSETQECLQFSKEQNIYPIVETYPFNEFPKAFQKLEKGQARYRVVVNVTDWAKANGFHK